MKRGAGSAVDVAATPTSSPYQQCTSSSAAAAVAAASAATASLTDVRFTPNLTTLWTNGDQLRQSLPFSK